MLGVYDIWRPMNFLLLSMGLIGRFIYTFIEVPEDGSFKNSMDGG